MSKTSQLYRRLDEWTRNLSRVEYASLAGLTSTVAVFIVGALFGGELVTVQAVTMGLTMAVVYYLFNPNEQE
ncbi:hypothetical protein M0R89_07965 [Halorussus limi]|uniref:Uncharacterized protein n=1 Tax=Halorussus limi TaxID=2938695 RepID=A0A8U0HZM1_9EURY|nr:hypothetical protein [Halorussus limi]UPV75984.1 hypothetical protein M0R89_07965 [Halorussus limi]